MPLQQSGRCEETGEALALTLDLCPKGSHPTRQAGVWRPDRRHSFHVWLGSMTDPEHIKFERSTYDPS